MRELLHPPAHRGPLIAAGAVTLSVGVALALGRLQPASGWVLLVTGALAAAWLWLGLQGADGAPPPAFASVLLFTGLAAFALALLSLADVLGADELGSGTLTWTSALLAVVATAVSRRRSSAVAALIAALAGGLALLAAWDWIFDPEGVTPFRWLLLLLAFAYGLASLPMRGTSLRHAEQMVNAAGTAILAIPLIAIPGSLFGTPELPGFWELVILVAGLSLVAYAAADRAPGPGYLGAANLAAFVIIAGAGSESLLWWPLLLIVIGAAGLLAGLRPRRPLPPEPASSTRPDDLPLTVRVHRD
jgi:hypothetical protein